LASTAGCPVRTSYIEQVDEIGRGNPWRGIIAMAAFSSIF